MVCRNCGNQLIENEKFCTVCGHYNGDEEENQNNDMDITIPKEPIGMVNNENELINIDTANDIQTPPDLLININDTNNNHPETEMNENRYDRLLEAYVGEDYQEIVRKKINLYAFIFNLFYFLYRKMYIIGIIGLSILWILAIKYPILIIPYIIIVAIISGVLFNPIYLKIAKIKINNLKKNSPSDDDFELIEICRKKGGVNVVIALLIYLVFIISIIGTLFSFRLFFNGKGKYWDENNNNRANCRYLSRNSLFYARNNGISGEIEESVCKKFGTDDQYFDVYLKMKSIDGSFSYLYFSSGNEGIDLTNNTEKKNALENKRMNGTITEEEKKQLEEYEQIESNYKKIKTDSEKYEQLPSKIQKNTERSSYVFSKEELLK